MRRSPQERREELKGRATIRRVPQMSQSIPGLDGLMLKLKLQYSGHLMQKTNSLEKTLMLGKIRRQEEKGMTEDELVGWHH